MFAANIFKSSKKLIVCPKVNQLQALRKISTRPVTNALASTVFRTEGGQNSRSSSVAGALIAAAFASSTALYMQQNAQCEPAADKFAKTALYPPIAPYEEGFLQVDGTHRIAYQLYGNPKGKEVLFVHGGPGGGTEPTMARYFDPKYYKVVLVDQRGCGNSTPFANLENNTTYDSVKDFEKLREKLNIEKWMVFGGSWGSTLALAYAMEHPTRVTELVLRGIFLLRKQEIDWLYQGPGANFLFPEDWKVYDGLMFVDP